MNFNGILILFYNKRILILSNFKYLSLQNRRFFSWEKGTVRYVFKTLDCDLSDVRKMQGILYILVGIFIIIACVL